MKPAVLVYPITNRAKRIWDFQQKSAKTPFLVLAAATAALSFAPVESAFAIPSFARQTGMACHACHTAYPQLTPLGRQFKMNGYTMSSGKTPAYERVSAWLQGSFTHTRRDQAGGAGDGFGDNDNFALQQVSFFYGGKIFGKVGGFLQGTYDGIGKVWGWDNMDVRYADTGSLGKHQLTYGISLNNSPTAQDLWNTTPTWGFPFDASDLAPGPSAATLIEGGLGQITAGVTAYAMVDNHLYAEFGGYHVIPHGAIQTLTGDASDAPKSKGVAPYWRVAWEQNSGSDDIEIGAFGIHALLYPEGDMSMGADSYTDVGFDAQYQHFAGDDSVTARISTIQEYQRLNASEALGGADNLTNRLHTLNANVAYLLDQTYQMTGGVEHIWGVPDATLYGTPNGSPSSTYLTFEGDWLPLNKHPWAAYPWFNPKLSAQYVHYLKLDGVSNSGGGDKASYADTLFLLLTLTL
ncbi:MAG: cytochrome C [Alphaproteobacteria bacterium]|nr:cytochrome C [Alphaproteobacteria bacterium]